VDATNASLTADISVDRWITILDALSFSPVRHQVEPSGIPASPSEELLAAVRKHSSRLPEIAARFGVDIPSRPGARAAAKPVPPPPPPPSADVSFTSG
jgi:hypothetical protein